VVRDGPGFLINRLLLPYLIEAMHLLQEGVNPLTVDRVLSDFGMPLGPLALLDEIGIDVGFHVAEILAKAFPDRVVLPALLGGLARGKGFHGKKSGKGFYSYDGEAKKLNPELMDLLRSQGAQPSRGRIDRKTILQRCLFVMINEAAVRRAIRASVQARRVSEPAEGQALLHE